LLKIGDGHLDEANGKIDIHENLCATVKTVYRLISEIYPDIRLLNDKPVAWLRERALLTRKNDMAVELNDILLRRFEVQEMVYKSVETVTNRDETVSYPVEFLNTLNRPGMPAHRL
jgi:hypothetical protein